MSCMLKLLLSSGHDAGKDDDSDNEMNYVKIPKFVKGSDQRKNRWVWSNVNTRYLVWRCGDGGSFAL